MSYEFNPDNQVFEFPNPYKVENLALLLSGGLMILVGIVIMLGIRDNIAHGLDGRVLGPQRVRRAVGETSWLLASCTAASNP